MSGPASATGEEGIPSPSRALAVGSVLAAMVLVVLDAAIANVALPTISQALQVSPAASVRVVTAYQLGLVVSLLPAAALGESIGLRRVFVAGAGLFTGASLLCALAPSLAWLVAARFVQGLGGAAIMALGVALLREVVPRRRLGAAIGWNALAVALSSAAGPAIGAGVLGLASWPWLFAVNLPVGAIVLLAARALPRREGTGRALDRPGIALNAAAFASLVLGAECWSTRPAVGLALLAAAASAGTMLFRRDARLAVPLVPLDLLRRASFRVSVIASVLCFTGQSAALVALPFHLQRGFGLSPLATGLLLASWPLTVAIAGPLAGRLSDRVSGAWLCLSGGALLAAGLAAASAWPSHGGPWPLVPFLMVCGLGFGLFNVPNNRNMFLSAPQARSGAAGGLQGIARLTGQTTGALMAALLFELVPSGAAPRVALAVGAVLTLAGGVASLWRAGATAVSPAPSRDVLTSRG